MGMECVWKREIRGGGGEERSKVEKEEKEMSVC